MFKINAVKISITTNDKPFGLFYRFTDGINLIHGSNSSGKSTCLDAIIYALGIEELLGGKKEKTMKPVIRSELKYEGKIYRVLESEILVEIENQNGEIITIKRAVTSESRNTNLVTVYKGAILTKSLRGISSEDMFLHSPGSATNELGFHTFFEDFILWNLPLVPYYEGEDRKLYLQAIFPSFLIEQLKGWSGFLATIPTYYGIKNVQKRVIEFILSLEVIENEKKRIYVDQKKRSISNNWRLTIDSIKYLSDRIYAKEILGLPPSPTTQLEDNFNIMVEYNGKTITLQDHLEKLQNELSILQLKSTVEAKKGNIELQQELERVMRNLNASERKYKEISNELRLDRSNLRSLNEQLELIESDLIKNKDIRKLQRLGSKQKLKIVENYCPTCEQRIKDSLLPQQIEQIPMGIEENISFLEGQKKMLKYSISSNKIGVEKKENEIKRLSSIISEQRKFVRIIKRELVADDRLPSETDIQKKITIENKVEDIIKIQKEFRKDYEKIINLSLQWKDYLEMLSEIPDKYFSEKDTTILNYLKQCFIHNLRTFGYKSKSPEQIDISFDKYIPTVDGFDMKFDSSASDHIRSIWAYTCALQQVSMKFRGNHPGLIVMDEPGQHEMDFLSILRLFEVLNNLSENGQVIVLSSITESELKELSNKVKYNLLKITSRSIHPIDQDKN